MTVFYHVCVVAFCVCLCGVCVGVFCVMSYVNNGVGLCMCVLRVRVCFYCMCGAVLLFLGILCLKG